MACFTDGRDRDHGRDVSECRHREARADEPGRQRRQRADDGTGGHRGTGREAVCQYHEYREEQQVLREIVDARQVGRIAHLAGEHKQTGQRAHAGRCAAVPAVAGEESHRPLLRRSTDEVDHAVRDDRRQTATPGVDPRRAEVGERLAHRCAVLPAQACGQHPQQPAVEPVDAHQCGTATVAAGGRLPPVDGHLVGAHQCANRGVRRRSSVLASATASSRRSRSTSARAAARPAGVSR